MSEDLQTPETKTDARARAAADKAYRKASRPWFKKKRFIFTGIILLFIVIGVATGGGDDEKTPASDAAAAPPAAAETAAAEQPSQEAAAPAEQKEAEAPAADAGPAFPGAEKSDVIGNAGDALALKKVTVTSTALFDGDATLGATLCTTATLQNGSDKTMDFNLYDWKLQAPSGTITDPTFIGTDNILSSGQVAPGGTATGDICFENKAAEPGQFVILYEPILEFFSDRSAWINNR